MGNPLSPSPSNSTPAYQPTNPVMRESDGSAARDVVAQHPRAHSPAPVIRDEKGRIKPGSGRKPGR